MEQKETIYRKGYEFGMGVTKASGSPVGLGVIGTEDPVKGATGGSGSFRMISIQTTEELESHLGISAKASGGVGLFNADARFSFAQECKCQASSLMLLLTCTREFGFVQIDDPSLSKGAAELVAKGDTEAFLEKYGDCFVRGMTTGGQFFGVIRIDTTSTESRKTVQGALSGSYGPFSADVESNITEAMKSTNSKAEVFLHYEGGVVNMKPETPQQLFKAADEWSSSLDNNRKPYSVTLAPYVIANGPPPPNSADRLKQQDILERCARLRSTMIDNLNLVEYMLNPNHKDEFEAVLNGPDLAALHASLSKDLNIIARTASFAIENPKEAIYIEEFANIKLVPPIPNYQITVLPVNLPRHSGSTVRVPDFRSYTSEAEIKRVAAEKRLSLHWVNSNNFITDKNPWHVEAQNPPPNSEVSPGTTITLTIPSFLFLPLFINLKGAQAQKNANLQLGRIHLNANVINKK